jgi:hypothetical protein
MTLGIVLAPVIGLAFAVAVDLVLRALRGRSS